MAPPPPWSVSLAHIHPANKGGSFAYLQHTCCCIPLTPSWYSRVSPTAPPSRGHQPSTLHSTGHHSVVADFASELCFDLGGNMDNLGPAGRPIRVQPHLHARSHARVRARTSQTHLAALVPCLVERSLCGFTQHRSWQGRVLTGGASLLAAQ